MNFLSVNGMAVHVATRTARDGAPTIAFSNSLGTDLRIWDALVARLPPAWGVVRYDSRGHGLTALGATPYTLADHVGDLAGVLAATVEGPVVLCGLSVGGLVAQAFARTHPEQVAGLVLCCTGMKVGTAAAWDERMATVEAGGLAALLDPVMERWFTPAFRSPTNPLFEGVRAMFVRQSPVGYVATCATLKEADLRGEAGRIAVPTLCVAAAADGSTPPDLVRAMADAIPGSRFVLVEDAAHIVCLERPDALADAITRFVADQRAPA